MTGYAHLRPATQNKGLAPLHPPPRRPTRPDPRSSRRANTNRKRCQESIATSLLTRGRGESGDGSGHFVRAFFFFSLAGDFSIVVVYWNVGEWLWRRALRRECGIGAARGGTPERSAVVETEGDCKC